MRKALLSSGLGAKAIAGLLAAWDVSVVVLLASTAITKWPGMHHDAVLYLSAIVNVGSTGEWRFESYAFAMVALGRSTFDSHGVLYQFLFGRILGCATYEAFFAWAAFLNVMTYVATVVLVRRTLKSRFPDAVGWLFASGIASSSALACLY